MTEAALTKVLVKWFTIADLERGISNKPGKRQNARTPDLRAVSSSEPPICHSRDCAWASVDMS